MTIASEPTRGRQQRLRIRVAIVDPRTRNPLVAPSSFGSREDAFKSGWERFAKNCFTRRGGDSEKRTDKPQKRCADEWESL